RPPDEWFALADVDGRRLDLEVACWNAFAEAGPPPDGGMLFVNTSPATLVDRRLEAVRDRLPARLVIELTEQEAVADYELLRRRLQRWSNDGVRLAIDDIGAGYSSLRHVLQLSPEFLKLDRSIISGIDADRSRRALVCSLVAFAREVGATVIAEGVEHTAELDVLEEAGVPLVQGWLFGRPGPPWMRIDAPPARRHTTSAADGTTNHGSMPAGSECSHTSESARFDRALAGAADGVAAANAACEHLFRMGQMIPSVYIERDGLLRCVAQRGYWQILDGIPVDTGLLANAVSHSKRILYRDVSDDADFLASAPGIVDEMAVPLVVGGRTIGGLNVESSSRLTATAESAISDCGVRLARRLDQLGIVHVDSAMHRLARSTKRLAGLSDLDAVRAESVEMAREISQMDSALLVQLDGMLTVVAAVGPLALAFRSMPATDIALLATMVSRVSSCYTAGDLSGRAVAGTETLREAGAAEIAVVPLISLGRRSGFLLVANTSPMRLSTDEIEPLELLASETAQSLELAATVAELRHRASSDPLTGLGNHSAFYAALRNREGHCAVAIMDLDHFKTVNDGEGHLAGDRLLRRVGKAIRTSIGREGDAYRIGGDEFAAILPDLDLPGARAVGDRICGAVNSILESHGASVSIGLTLRRPHEPTHAVVDRADRSLYRAKRAGRGRVAVA
ncbi:MAG: EAL domain-containing protein, partial [Ilumatobacter sp.]